ncbi:response regulator transcription factor [Sutterella megalosphaeroides]|uniref:DNA-binding response regulator n=1 Tax=Sutterella megalosphaeroides TaxID=2494234 RepID=A0A2Z6ICC9_9BURK|nr:response regulator [Sutterella megalosphaeroides]BBF23327.1 DNA-binding response regulator [Sutterella megalosphaeroides]
MRREPFLIRILDDDEALCDAISFLLEGEGYETVVYSSAEAFLKAGDVTSRGCLLLDVKMTGMTGPQLQERLLAHGSTLPIVFLSAHGSIDLAVDVMQKGAVSFLPKPVGAERLLEAVRRAEDNPVYGHTAQRRSPVPEAAPQLSDRERQVVALVGQNLTSRQIAERIGVSRRTIEFFRSNAMRKLGVRSAAELKEKIASGTFLD